MTGAHGGIALFDLDGTLVYEDTMLVWLVTVCGFWPTVWGLLKAIAIGPFHKATGAEDWRGRIKAYYLKALIKGVGIEQARDAGADMRRKLHWRRKILIALKNHQEQGHRVVIVTGAADLYIPALFAEIGYDDLIATTLEVNGNVLTGRMAQTNNVRQAKGRQVAAYLERHGPFAEIWAYGNLPHDREMLALADHPTVV